MSSVSRHKACKLCRDRKVRCDGEQPTCEKCRRIGETCEYNPTYKPTKAGLVQTIESLRERLGKPMVTTFVWALKRLTWFNFPKDRAESRFGTQDSSSFQTNNGQPSPVPDSTMSVDCLDYPPFGAMPMPSSITGPAGMSPPSNCNGHTITQPPSTADSDFLTNFPMMVCNEMSGFRVEDMIFPDHPSESPLLQKHLPNLSQIKIPSLREIRALNSSSSTPFPKSNLEKGNEQAEASNRILAELQNFSSTIFVTQAEIAGISSAVAEYLAWVRNVPGMPKAPDCAAVLETLETRARELHSIAENKHWTAWRQMLEKLDDLGNVQLSAFGAEMQKRLAEMAQAFHASYDVGKAIQDQSITSVAP